MNNLAWVKGLIFGALFSFIIALLFMLIGQAWAGGITSFWGESWLYFSVIIPFAITFAVLGGYFHNRKELSNKKIWLISLISAFLVTLYSGTVGAIFGETIVRGGLETINVEGTLVWGTIYAFILLPLTTPFARFLIGIFYKIVRK
jgi:RsiW-degrading membrane proteinase PrsW (M82 family)